MQIFLLLLSLLSMSWCKLYQVFSLIRHGARYHSQLFYDSAQTRPLWYELTAVGMRQHQRLGQLLRKQYVEGMGFVGAGFNATEFEIYSTPTNRTIQSAQAMFYGMYPAGTGPRMAFIDRYLRLPPYSNKTDIEEQNYALPNAHQPIKIKTSEKAILINCPNYAKYTEQNFEINKLTVQEMNTTYFPFLKRLSTMFNFSLPNATLYTFVSCYDNAAVNRFLGRPLPAGFTDDDYRNLEHWSNWYWHLAMSGNNAFMANSNKLQRMLSLFDLRTKLVDNYALKWTFLFGHDTDIVAMQQALNISNFTCVEQLYRKGTTPSVQCDTGGSKFASNIFVQLHSNNKQDFYVKVRSNGRYVKICGKANMQCDYYEFKSMIRKAISNKTIDQLCGKTVKGLDYELFQAMAEDEEVHYKVEQS